MAAEIFREAPVLETPVRLGAVGPGVAAVPGPVAREVLPVWEGADSVVEAAAIAEAGCAVVVECAAAGADGSKAIPEIAEEMCKEKSK